MKAWEIGPRGGIESLRQVERSDPVAGPGEILVGVIAAGLNYRDLMILRGTYGTDLPEARIPLTDGVGMVEAVGEGVTDFVVGDRVVASNFVDWDPEGGFGFHIFGRDIGVSMDGWLAQKIVLPAKAAIKVPDAISDATAATACRGCGYGVARNGRVRRRWLRASWCWRRAPEASRYSRCNWPRRSVRSLRSRRPAMKSSPARGKWARTTPSITANGPTGRLRCLRRPMGAAPILWWTQSALALCVRRWRPPGLKDASAPLARCQALQRSRMILGFGAILGKNITIKGITSGHRGMLTDALALMAEKGVETLVDSTFGFDDAKKAYAHLEGGSHMGKIRIQVQERRSTPRT